MATDQYTGNGIRRGKKPPIPARANGKAKYRETWYIRVQRCDTFEFKGGSETTHQPRTGFTMGPLTWKEVKMIHKNAQITRRLMRRWVP